MPAPKNIAAQLGYSTTFATVIPATDNYYMQGRSMRTFFQALEVGMRPEEDLCRYQ